MFSKAASSTIFWVFGITRPSLILKRIVRLSGDKDGTINQIFTEFNKLTWNMDGKFSRTKLRKTINFDTTFKWYMCNIGKCWYVWNVHRMFTTQNIGIPKHEKHLRLLSSGTKPFITFELKVSTEGERHNLSMLAFPSASTPTHVAPATRSLRASSSDRKTRFN